MNKVKYISKNMVAKFLVCFLCGIIGGISGLYYSGKNNEYKYQSTIFLSFAGKSSFISENIQIEIGSNLIQTVDAFTESVQGQLLNPSFTESIIKNAKGNIEFKAKKQEKQNILITYLSVEEESAKKFAHEIETKLNNYLEKYNSHSGMIFTLINFDHNLKNNENNSTKGLILGFIVATIAAYMGFKLFDEMKKISD